MYHTLHKFLLPMSTSYCHREHDKDNIGIQDQKYYQSELEIKYHNIGKGWTA